MIWKAGCETLLLACYYILKGGPPKVTCLLMVMKVHTFMRPFMKTELLNVSHINLIV
jgi:hypothetical protein